jgi:secreted Zn-dependent insulinase-like peptidase
VNDNFLPSAVLFLWTTTCYIFVPTVQLTDRGERHIDAIIAIVFQYIHLLKQSPPPRQLAPPILEEKKSSFRRVQTFPYLNIMSGLNSA